MDTSRNDCLMIGSYICGLNSDLFLHTDKNHSFLQLNAEKHLHFDFVILMFALNLFLHRIKNEFLTNGNFLVLEFPSPLSFSLLSLLL